jgi:alpha-mannosidase
MPMSDAKIIETRIRRWFDRIQKHLVTDLRPFTAEFGHSAEPVPFADRLGLDYRPIGEGDVWGEKWDSAWFRLRADVPGEFAGRRMAAVLDFSGEGLVFTPDGRALQGITHGSIWNPDFARTRVGLDGVAVAGQELEIWVEAAANSLFGVFTEPDLAPDDPRLHGWFEAKAVTMQLGVFDEALWHLYLDLRILLGFLKHLPETSLRRARILRVLNRAADVHAAAAPDIAAVRAVLAEELGKPAGATRLNVSAVGHAHIDTAWLWPVRESIRKCARTFATQLRIMEEYPDYVFGASQPQHYQFMKDHYPEIYARMGEAVRRGQWEVQGAMWVEADCNLIGGESMVRQILQGKNFFRDEFGVDVRELWLPDVFGYSAALPQILRKAGVDHFLTQKLSWNQTNEFPHQTFLWRGVDGSEVLTHFPPENSYCSELDTEFLLPVLGSFRERDRLDECVSLFGVGDGGGGPKPENVELGRRLADLEDAPVVSFGKAADFFTRLATKQSLLETWVGELYLELHRGTFTTQAAVKKENRRLENRLLTVEMLCSLLPAAEYPRQELQDAWRTLLLNQFHDIIPGSSIHMVYEVTAAEYAQLHATLDRLTADAAARLLPGGDMAGGSTVLFNSLAYRWRGLVPLPADAGDGPVQAAGPGGAAWPVQRIDGRDYLLADLPPLSFTPVTLAPATGAAPAAEDADRVLENDLVRYEFDDRGRLVAALDKVSDRDLLAGEGNVFSLYEDRPNDWDAWDIDAFYRDAGVQQAECVEMGTVQQGPAAQVLRLAFRVGRSDIRQHVTLAAGSRRLDFRTEVDWREKHRLLRVQFPADVHTDQATFDIQYAHVRRSTHRNTSWDRARFEVLNHRYVDLSDHDGGLALLNDCKYGVCVHDNVLDLSLLRSPTNPDPQADEGRHAFTYSLLPHDGDLVRSDVMAEAACLNREPVFLPASAGAAADLALPVRLEADGIDLTVLKRAEKDDSLVLRLVETAGRRSRGTLRCRAELQPLDLMEWHTVGEAVDVDGDLAIELAPFEIRTYRVRLR